MKQTLLRTAACLLLAFSSLALCAETNWIAPAPVGKVPYTAKLLPGGAIEIKLGPSEYVVNGEFSLRPGFALFQADAAKDFATCKVSGDTLSATGPDFRFERKIERLPEAVLVTDRITNTGKADLPFMYRQFVRMPSIEAYRICGYQIYASRGNGTNSINSTTIVMPKTGGALGMLAVSDVFRVHFYGYAAKKMYGIADNTLVIRPGVTQEMVFALFPTPTADYYDQINAMRRFLGVNYCIPKGFAFLTPYPRGVVTFQKGVDRIGKENTVEELRQWLDNKSAGYISAGAVSQNGETYGQGSAWLKTAKPEIHRAFYAKLRQAKPDIKIFHYFHCFIDIKDALAPGFDNEKLLTPSGTQADYRNPKLPLYLPTEGSAFAKMQESRLAKLKNDYGVDGIFWDEFPYSAAEYHYGEPWDGVSADIHPRTHEIVRRKSSVAMVTMPWRKRMVEWIAANKMLLIANGGGGYTATMTQLFNKHHFLAFMETGSITNLLASQLSTPIGLGDHLAERNELDCYRNQVRWLQYGSVYFYYHQQVEPFTHYTLSRYMFPITPVELHEGYIIGKERILTAISGNFSFGGNEKAEAHFFDANGYEVKREAPAVQRDGRTYYQITLGENESCALVRK